MTKTEAKRRNWKARQLYVLQCKKLRVKPAENCSNWGERRLTDDLQLKYQTASKWRRRRALKALGYSGLKLRDLLARI